jgi:two-component system alkaline phosphatase synthesis response regulator PhoP
VWGYDDSVMSRTVDTHVAELRRKLESDPANPRHILTVLKTGYRLTRD